MEFALDAASRYARLHDAIVNMIEICEEQQPEILNTKMHIGSRNWVEQFCTVRIAGPRRSGHTTAIMSLIQQKYNRVLVLTKNMTIAKTIESMLEQLELSKKAVVSSVNRINALSGQSMFEAIIVDGSHLLDADDIEKVYEIAMPHSEGRRTRGENFVVIFLQ